jgi:hypothetical protein
MEKKYYATCQNLRPYKMKNHNGWWKLIFEKKNHFHQKIPIMSCVKF